MAFLVDRSVRPDTVYRVAVFILFLLLAACGSSKNPSRWGAQGTPQAYTPYGQLPCGGNGVTYPGAAYACGSFVPSFVIPNLSYRAGWYTRDGIYCGMSPDVAWGRTLYYYDNRAWARVSYRSWTGLPTGGAYAGAWGIPTSGGVYFWASGRFELKL